MVVRPESLRLFSEDPVTKGIGSKQPVNTGRKLEPDWEGRRELDSLPPFLEGKIEKVVYLGSVCEYEIDVGWEKPVLAVTHNPIEEGFFNPGDRVGIDFSPISAHALPGNS